MAGKDVSISYADGSGRAARGEALALGDQETAGIFPATPVVRRYRIQLPSALGGAIRPKVARL